MTRQESLMFCRTLIFLSFHTSKFYASFGGIVLRFMSSSFQVDKIITINKSSWLISFSECSRNLRTSWWIAWMSSSYYEQDHIFILFIMYFGKNIEETKIFQVDRLMIMNECKVISKRHFSTSIYLKFMMENSSLILPQFLPFSKIWFLHNKSRSHSIFIQISLLPLGKQFSARRLCGKHKDALIQGANQWTKLISETKQLKASNEEDSRLLCLYQRHFTVFPTDLHRLRLLHIETFCTDQNGQET